MSLALALVLQAGAPVPVEAPPTQSDLARGAALRQAGRPAEAIPFLESATRANPADADAWLNLGLAYSVSQRFGDAERALDRALALAPDYTDVRIARARLAYYMGDPGQAERRLAPVLAAEPANREALALADEVRRARVSAPPAWRLDASAGYASLSKNLPSSRSAAVFLGRGLANGAFVAGGVEHLRQFGVTDTFYSAQLGNRWGHLTAGGTPDADFRPKVTVGGQLDLPPWALAGAWTVQLGVAARWARYPVGDVSAAEPYVTLARAEALQLTARWINVLDERDVHRAGYGLSAAWRPAPPMQFTAGWADAPESSDGVTTKVRAASLGANVDVSDRLTLRLVGVREARDAYRRDEVAVGMTRRF